MIAWIDCGLPWACYDPPTNYPVHPKLNKRIKKEFGKSLGDAFDEVKKLYQPSSEEYATALAEYKAFSNKINEWYKQQPEYKKYQEEVAAYEEEYAKKSFCGGKLNKPGTLIEVSVNGELKQLLIGDINTYGGVCDDCMDFDRDAVVIRYKPMEV